MLYMIRHGQTARNKDMLLQGRSDLPLNETGIRQAREAGRRLRESGIRIDEIWSSPLQRAMQTAEILREELQGMSPDREIPILTDERLLEIDYGAYEGLGFGSLPPEMLTFFEDFVHNPAPEGMESLQAVVARAGDFIESIRERAGEKNILLSFHAIIMKGVLEYLTPDSGGSYWYGFLGNCEVYAAETGNGHIDVPARLFAGVSDGIAERMEEIFSY